MAAPADSILLSVKKVLGLPEDHTAFDADIMLFTSSVLGGLNQFGVGPDAGFSLDGYETTWTELIGDHAWLRPVKAYVALRVRRLFDPPKDSATANSMDAVIKEEEWRIINAVELRDKTETP